MHAGLDRAVLVEPAPGLAQQGAGDRPVGTGVAAQAFPVVFQFEFRIEIQVAGMVGASPGRDGKLKAASKLGPSTIDGLDGRFSVSGRVSDGMMQLVFVAEYFHKRKPFCVQSWNVSGLRQSELEKKH